MTGEDLACGRLVAPFDLAVPNTEAFYLITPSEDAAHPDAALFRDWLLEESDLAFGPHLRS